MMVSSVPTSDEGNRYADFVGDIIAALTTMREVPTKVWHYTTGQGLLGIIESGELWSTQISCLNDHSELRYSKKLFAEAILATPTDDPPSIELAKESARRPCRGKHCVKQLVRRVTFDAG